MKTGLWLLFYSISFLGFILAMYFGKDPIFSKTIGIPIFNCTNYHQNMSIADSIYSKKYKPIAGVEKNLQTEWNESLSQLQEQNQIIAEQKLDLDKLMQENKILKKKIRQSEEQKESIKNTREEKKLQELAQMLGSMKYDVLSPILVNLPDKLVQLVYEKARVRDRTKIFNALPADRAGKILSDMATN